jgi:hypothetical protein
MDGFLFGLFYVSGSSFLGFCNLGLVCFCATGFVLGELVFEFLGESTEVGELFFELSELSLQGGFLEELGFLISIEFLLRYQIVE